MELKDKVAIITGASSGIGKAVAHNLNDAGVKFVLAGRREERLSALRDELNHAAIFPCDLHRDWEVQPAQSLDVPRPLQPEDIARVVRFILEQPDHVRLPRILAVPADQEL